MAALMGFLPFIVFALVEKLAGPVPGLAAGALMSVALLVHDRRRGESGIDILEAGCALMFAALAVAALRGGDAQAWSIWRVRLWVDAGMVLIVLCGLAWRKPFTLKHARRLVSPEVARKPSFMRSNMLLSGVWAVAFAAHAAIDLLMVLRPETPTTVAVAMALGALAAAAGFTRWYPQRARAQAAARRTHLPADPA